jgi:hypothetical protein
MPGTILEDVSTTWVRHLASTVSRRSFIWRLGTGVAGISLGAEAAESLTARSAYAASGCCGCKGSCCTDSHGNSVDSISCTEGYGQNSCPDSSSPCGCWCITVAESDCRSGFKKWCDCCGGCDNGDDCHCVTSNTGIVRPSCCRNKCWQNGGGDCSQFIKCRYNACISQSECNSLP